MNRLFSIKDNIDMNKLVHIRILRVYYVIRIIIYIVTTTSITIFLNTKLQ